MVHWARKSHSQSEIMKNQQIFIDFISACKPCAVENVSILCDFDKGIILSDIVDASFLLVQENQVRDPQLAGVRDQQVGQFGCKSVNSGVILRSARLT
jgi:hypothetical protein